MKADASFAPAMAKALDSYAVPPVPKGFSDRVMARISSGGLAENPVLAAPLVLRPRHASPWRRTSRLVIMVAAISVATATAAAAGIFGSAVYVPGVSEMLVEAKIVEKPKAAMPRKVQMATESKSVEPPASKQFDRGSAAIISRVSTLRSDPEFSKLTPRQRLAVTRSEVRKMIHSGEVDKQDVRAAVRELVREADPATKEAWRKAASERQERRMQRREAMRTATPEARAAFRSALRERREALQSDRAFQ